eukprot:TRINITY_DN1000_c1_g1_i1.p1 TRINITY_DN1000_c1_g1~~TRINITY_DN1000_c1_g1_i1.p1  ORF type:complete len:366 (+),score=124.61 TRINITY_DN1000_c1_g1_i1:52-1149(+)
MAWVMRRGAGVLAGFAVGCTFGNYAYCKPKDVPDYLMPFYLTTLRRRYNHYATGVNTRGKKSMTSEDFVRALLCARKSNQELKPTVIRDLEELFRVVDANGDGYISFAEFSLFMMFLTTSEDRFTTAFKMFDSNESGTVDVDEFKQMCKCLSTDSTVKYNFKGGITQKFFGSDYNNQLSVTEFWSFVDSLRAEVWRAEFRSFDHNDSGTIRPDQFAALVTNSMLGSHLPFYIVDNIRHMKTNVRLPAEIPYSAWETFNMILLNSQDIARLIQTFTAGGQDLDKDAFKRAVQITVPGIGDITTPTDLIFAIFDRDRNGSLEYDEFLSVARSKFTFNSMHNRNSDDQPPFFKHLQHCVESAWDKKWL